MYLARQEALARRTTAAKGAARGESRLESKKREEAVGNSLLARRARLQGGKMMESLDTTREDSMCVR